MEFGEIVNTLTKKFPKEERFELSSQFKRAADSIALNIAEGSSGTDPQFLTTWEMFGIVPMNVFHVVLKLD
ncbi:four helix bundle protein [Aquimarina sp. EL_43]|uniref:four helix bundle protein n=1 Tax=unclassified Aquimarina TaxID=2627091 RepID=UPI001A34333C|nr:four helix bundle protein [Aquimarina sp. EL_35]MBG6130098.1 four helix bundle protein [Aquimarina sp. EL_35]MBG6148878.1 four helix bundle protein [Aquimarina sp. EL_32]MBG6168748.1 four helix bundle protein [Aquimarina sp. EL_43]